MIYYKVKIRINNEIEYINITASSKLDAMNIVLHKNIGMVISAVKIDDKKSITLLQSKIKSTELFTIISMISSLYSAGFSLNQTIALTLEHSTSIKSKNMLKHVLISLESGKSLYQAFLPYKNSIGTIILSMIEVGEKSGELSRLLDDALNMMQRVEHTKREFFKAIRYPLFVITALLFAFSTIFIYVIPKFETIFSSYNMPLPLLTQIIISISKFLQSYAGVLILFISLGSLSILVLYNNLKKYKYEIDRFILKLPIISNIVMTYNISIYFLILSRLVQSNIQTNIALNIAKDTIANSYINQRLTTVSIYIDRGLKISQAYKKAGIIDNLSIQMISAGEHSGNILKSLEKISKIKTDNFDRLTNNISSFIEPILISFIAVFVLAIALGIFIPIWDIGSFI